MRLAFDIAEKVADHEQTSPLDLPPLNNSIDVDSLERCMDSAGEGARMQFTYCQYRIRVKGDGSVFIDMSETSKASEPQQGEG